MNHDDYDDAYIRGILSGTRTIAVVGASANPVRPSHFVAKYLVSKGYVVFPVNPGHAGKPIAGAMTHASLGDIDQPVDMVDIFRNSEAAYGVVEDALALMPLPRVIWMQLGVRNNAAAERAEAAGVKVVMNRCPKIEYARLCGEIGWAGVASNVVSSKRRQMRTGFQRYGLRR